MGLEGSLSRHLRVFRVIRGSYSQNLHKTIHESHESHETPKALRGDSATREMKTSSLAGIVSLG